MTTAEFIEKAFYNETKKRSCSSVFIESGIVYSYGYHYPLLFKVADHTFINTAGYSATTARHIYWARQAVNHEATEVELSRLDSRIINSGIYSDRDRLERLLQATAGMVARATEARDAKKRKDTWVYQRLTAKLEKAQASHAVVENLLREVA
jgi:hypothetical protein